MSYIGLKGFTTQIRQTKMDEIEGESVILSIDEMIRWVRECAAYYCHRVSFFEFWHTAQLAENAVNFVLFGCRKWFSEKTFRLFVYFMNLVKPLHMRCCLWAHFPYTTIQYTANCNSNNSNSNNKKQRLRIYCGSPNQRNDAKSLLTKPDHYVLRESIRQNK